MSPMFPSLLLLATFLAIGFINATAEEPIRLHNWGGNVMFSTQNIQYPRTVAQVQQIVKCSPNLRVVGSRHSFNNIADSSNTMLSTIGMNSIISLNSSVPSVRIQAGVTYTDLVPFLYASGFALPNLAALAEISVSGASQTGAHGSGPGNSNLATHIRSLQMVLANGTVATFGPSDPRLKALAVGLGAFGVITEMELNLVPTFNVTNYVFQNMPSENFYNNFDAIQRMGYSVNSVAFTFNPSVIDQITIPVRSDQQQNNNVSRLTSLLGATRSFRSGSPFTVEPNVELPWYNGLVNFRVGLSGVDGNEIQTEYFVPYSKAVPAIKAAMNLFPTVRSLATAFVIRTIKGDDLWMSPHSGGDRVAIHFSWANNMTALGQLLPKVEKALLPFGARPHWGKYFTVRATDFIGSYSRLGDFKKLVKEFDPKMKFRNNYLIKNVFLQ